MEEGTQSLHYRSKECCGLWEMEHKPFGYKQHIQKDGAGKEQRNPPVGM